MYALTQPLINLFASHPRLGGLFGLVIALLFGFLGISSWQDMQSMPQEPLRLSLAEASALVRASGEDQWVTLEKVSWDCANIVQHDNRARALFSDESETVLGVATLSLPQGSHLTCASLSPYEVTGILSPMSQGTYDRLDDTGFSLSGYDDASVRVALCTFCGRGNSRIGVVLAVILVPLGLAMYPMSLYLRRQRLLQT